MPFYTGIGSRETPQKMLDFMIETAILLDWDGYTLRSGGAEGADSAFAQGATESGHYPPEIYLPWKGFNGNTSPLLPSPEAFELAAKYHPAWNRCRRGARALHARNCHQVLGKDLKTPSEFVVCWTPDGSGSGGTGQAIRIAKAHKIPVYDLAIDASLKKFLELHGG